MRQYINEDTPIISGEGIQSQWFERLVRYIVARHEQPWSRQGCLDAMYVSFEGLYSRGELQRWIETERVPQPDTLVKMCKHLDITFVELVLWNDLDDSLQMLEQFALLVAQALGRWRHMH